MKKLLLFLLLPCISYGQVQIGEDIDGEESNDLSGISISLSNDGGIVAIGAIFNDGGGEGSGQVRIYENVNDDWIQLGQDIDGLNFIHESGRSVSLSNDGTIVAIGARGGEETFGQVRVFKYQGGNWVQIGQNIWGENEGDNLGSSISLSDDGNILAISISGSDNNGALSGQVRVYENVNDNWVQLGESIDGQPEDIFGNRVSLSNNGTILAASAISNDTNGDFAGQVRVFINDNGSWTQIGEDIYGQVAQELFGSSLSFSSNGEFLAVGARNTNFDGDTSGRVRVYQNQDGDWIQLGDDINGESEDDFSGISISLSKDGTILAIGAAGNDGNGPDSGHVRLYRIEAGNWIQIGEDIDGEAAGDNSGISVSLSSDGSIIAIGASRNGNNAGHVRVFDLSSILSTQDNSLTNFSLYPNPTKNNLTINLSGSDTLHKATIYNSLGQEVLNTTQRNIDVSSLSKGVYVVEVQTSTGKGSEKLIIQ